MTSFRTEVKWAIIFSLMTLVWMVLEKVTGLHSKYIDYHLYITNLFAIPAIIVMIMALKEKKLKDYKGQMKYFQGLTSGAVISVIIAVISPLTQWITTYIITPEYFPNVIKRSVELGYYATTAEAETQFNYSNYAFQGAVSALIMGIVTTAIAMIFIKSPVKGADI